MMEHTRGLTADKTEVDAEKWQGNKTLGGNEELNLQNKTGNHKKPNKNHDVIIIYFTCIFVAWDQIL